jgi:hypothetical protein
MAVGGSVLIEASPQTARGVRLTDLQLVGLRRSLVKLLRDERLAQGRRADPVAAGRT